MTAVCVWRTYSSTIRSCSVGPGFQRFATWLSNRYATPGYNRLPTNPAISEVRTSRTSQAASIGGRVTSK